MSMSFFRSERWQQIRGILFGKYIEDPAVLWYFACFVVLACAIIYPLDKRMAADTPAVTVTHTKNLYEILYDKTDDSYPVNADVTVEEPSKLYAKYALLMDATNRRVLYEKDGYEQVPMASTTKIMTLLVALEQTNPDTVVTVSDYAASMPNVKLHVKKGEQYRLGDLFYSLMLESHNDSAVVIAEAVGGSVEEFARLMNDKAKLLGATHTNFVTPNGLDDEQHYTTAYDLALIASAAIENLEFCKIIQTPSYTFHEQTTGRSFTVNNKDRFLTSYDGAIGIKTGFTGNAGYCFVGAVKREDRQLVSVVLASGWPPNKTYKWKDTTQLMNYGNRAFQMKEVVKKGTQFQPIPVTDSIEGGSITPYAAESVALLVGQQEEVTFDISLPNQLEAPVKKGATVGNIAISIDDEPYKVISLYAAENKSRLTYEYVLKNICRRFFSWICG